MPDEFAAKNKLKNDLEETEVYFPKDKKVFKEVMFSFTYYQMQQLKKLLLASKDLFGYTTEQYLKAAMRQGITRDEAVFFYQDVVEELPNASRPRRVVEAFLPLLYKVQTWNPIQISNTTTYKSLEELVKDLDSKELNNFSINSSLNGNW